MSTASSSSAPTSTTSRVLALLAASDAPMTAYDILGRLSRHGVRSPPTVYRALERLVRDGVVHRLESMNAFVACRHTASHAHVGIFGVCTQCGIVQEMDAPGLARATDRAARGFFADIHSRMIEIKGVCRVCHDKG